MANTVDRTFTVKVDDKDVVYEIKTPTTEILDEAYKVYNTAFANAIKSKALLRAKLDDFVREQGLWDESKEAEVSSLTKEIRDSSLALSKGGVKLKQAKEIALKVRRLRVQLRNVMSVKSELDSHTAEGQADNARFNYLVSACTVYNDTKKPVFADLAEYNSRSSQGIAIAAATKYASLAYDLKDNYEAELPENKFLREFKFVDSELRLVDKDNNYIDEEGRRVDKDGYYLNEQGQRTDIDGNLVDENGEYVVTRQAFLDDDGNPIS